MKERHYFTLYGFDNVKKETIRITNEESFATYQNPNRQVEKISICEEAKKFLKTKKNMIYFDKQILKGNKYGIATLHPSIKPTNPKLKDIICYIFGLDIDLEGATDIFNKEFNNLQVEEKLTDMVKEKEDSNLYNYADKWLQYKRELKERNDKISDYKGVLSNLENGRVLTRGNNKIAILIGTQYTGLVEDADKLRADGLFDQYSYQTETNLKVNVDDGIKVPNHKKPSYNPEDYTEEQLFDMANNYDTETEFAKNIEKEQKKIETYLLQHCPEGTQSLKSGNKELILTIKRSTPQKRVDVNKLKADPAMWNKYSKKGTDKSLFTVKKLV